jgi:hypothetical protein
MEPRSHISHIRRETFWIDDQRNCLLQQNPLSAKLKRTIEHLSEGLYSRDVHFIFELIQNAEDNHYADGVDPTLSFQLTPDDPTHTPGAEGALIIENNELGFQPDNIDAICDVGQSTKTKQEGYIGEKGIGFKSVFQVTCDPHVFSNGYSIRLPESDSLTALGYIVPVWVDSVPPRVKSGCTTIILPLKPGCFCELSKSLRSVAPETILFLKKIKSLSIQIDGLYTCTVIKDDCAAPLVRLLCEIVADTTAVASPGESFWVKTLTFQRPPEISAAKREKIIDRDVTVALPLSQTADSRGDVYAYLPVLTGSGLPFLVNADFLLTSSREGIKEDEPWNHWLRDCIAPCFVTAFRELLTEHEYRYQAYRFLPLLADHDRPEFFEEVATSIHESVKATAVIVKQHGEELVTPEGARRADQQFRELFSSPDLPVPFCRERLVSSRIECFKLKLDELGVPVVTAEDTVRCLRDAEWLAKRSLEWFIKCYEYLKTLTIDAALAQDLRACPIVPIEGRRLSCEAKQPIYLSASSEDRVFLQTVPALIRSPIAFLRSEFRSLIEKRPALVTWLPDILRVYPFSQTNYCVDIADRLNREYLDLDELAIISGTRFLARYCAGTDQIDDFPVVLSDKRRERLSALLAAPGVQHVVTPTAMEPGSGWQHVFETTEDRRHLAVLSNRYVQDRTVSVDRDVLRQFLTRRRITDTPLPRRHVVPGWNDSEQSAYERACFAATTERSSGVKMLRNAQSPSWLSQLAQRQPQENVDRKAKAVAAWLRRQGSSSAGSRQPWTEARVEYSYYGPHAKAYGSEFVRDLRMAAWLPTTAGAVVPKNAFIKDETISAILGQAAPYITDEMPDWAIDLLEVRRTATPKDLVGALEAQAEENASNPILAQKVYSLLAHLNAGKDVRQGFREKPLIHLPNHSKRWFRAGEVIWLDRSETFGDSFGYLEPTYPKLREFFVEDLGVKSDVDAESFANRWLALAMTSPFDAVDIERPMTQIFQALLPDCRRIRSGSSPPLWWGDFATAVRFWCRERGFKSPADSYVADDGEIRRLFAKCEAAFVWRPEKASYADIEDLYRALGAKFLSESVSIVCLNASSGVQVSRPAFLTAAAKAQILAWAANTLDKEQYERLHQGHILTALTETNEESVENLSIIFTLDRFIVVGKRLAYWDLRNKRLFVEDSGNDREAVRQEAAETIARGIMQNRPYRDVESLVFQVLCSDATRARSLISKRDWSLSAEGKSLLGEEIGKGSQQPDVSSQTLDGEGGQQAATAADADAETVFDYRTELEEAFDRPGKSPPHVNDSTGGAGLVTRPGHRRGQTAAEIAADHSHEPPREERTFEVLRQEWECPDPVIRQQLVEEYQGCCQICGEGFRKRNGEPFFISKYLVSRTKARTIDRLGNVLCLCANCSAKFQHGGVEMTDPVEQILALRTVAEGGAGEPAIMFRLCGEDRRIVFSERHLIDLQELIKQLSLHEDAARK